VCVVPIVAQWDVTAGRIKVCVVWQRAARVKQPCSLSQRACTTLPPWEVDNEPGVVDRTKRLSYAEIEIIYIYEKDTKC